MVDTTSERYDKAIAYGLMGLIFLLPLLVSPINHDFYNLPKAVFLHVTTLALLMVWVAKVVHTGNLEIERNPLDIPLLAFALVVLVGTIFSVNPEMSIFGQYRRYEGLPLILNCTFLFWLSFYYLRNEDLILRAMNAFALSALPVSLYGIAQYFGFEFLHVASQPFGGARSFSTLGNPVFLAAFLGMSLPLTGYAFIRSGGGPYRWLLGMAAISSFVCLLISYARSGWLGFLGALVFLAYEGRISFRPYRRQILALSAVALILILVGGLFMGALREVLSRTYERVVTLPTQTGMGTRISIWQSTLEMIADRPVLGYGPEVFMEVFPPYRKMSFIRLEGEEAMPDRAHNDLLQVTANFGLVGLISYLWILFAFGLVARKVLRCARGSVFHGAVTALLAACIAYLVQIQFQPGMVGVTPLFWVLMGITVSCGRLVSARGPWLKASLGLPQGSFSRLAQGLLLGLALVGALFLSSYMYRILRADIAMYRGAEFESVGALDRAIWEFRRAVELDPHHNLQRLHRGAAYVKKAKLNQDRFWADKAISVYREAIARDELDADAHLNYGDALFYYETIWDENKLAEAEAIYKKALELNPYFATAHQHLGRLYLRKGEFEKSVFHEKRALFIDPENISAAFELGQAYRRLGECEKAIQTFEKTVELSYSLSKAHPGLSSAFVADSYREMGAIYLEQGEADKAVECLEMTLEINPNDSEAKDMLDKARAVADR